MALMLIRSFHRSGMLTHALTAVLLLFLVIGMTWPLASKFTTHVAPGEISIRMVSNLNLWTLAWNYQWIEGRVPDYWDANVFYPHRGTLAYSEPQFGTALLTFPIFLLTRNEVTAYNVALLGFLWGAGMAVYATLSCLLPSCGTLGRRWLAAFVPAIAFALNPYVFREIGVLQLLAIPFMPLALLGLHRFTHRGEWRGGVLAAFGFLTTWYTCAYYGLFLTVFIVFFVCLSFRRRLLTRDFTLKALVLCALVAVALMPLFIGMSNAKSAMELTRPRGLVQALSAELKAYVTPSATAFWANLFGLSRAPVGHNIGYVLYALSAFSAVVAWRTGALRFSTDTRLGVGHSEDLTHRPPNSVRLWLAMAVLSFLLSLGMALAPTSPEGLGLFRILYWISPYNVLYEFFPGFSSIRSPYRFSIFLALFCALLAGFGVWWLGQLRTRARPFIQGAIVMLLLLDIWPLPVRLARVPRGDEIPSIYTALANGSTNTPLLELPLVGPQRGKLEDDSTYMLYSTSHWQPLINGYSGFAPGAYVDLIRLLKDGSSERIVAALSAMGVKRVLVHWDKLSSNERTCISALKDKVLQPIACNGSAELCAFVEPKGTEMGAPVPGSLRIYEATDALNKITVALRYEGPYCLVSTPWTNQIRMKLSWFRTLEALQRGAAASFVMEHYCAGSRLLQAGTVVQFDQPALPPGDYWVLAEGGTPGHIKQFILRCSLTESGFVDSAPVML